MCTWCTLVYKLSLYLVMYEQMLCIHWQDGFKLFKIMFKAWTDILSLKIIVHLQQ